MRDDSWLLNREHVPADGTALVTPEGKAAKNQGRKHRQGRKQSKFLYQCTVRVKGQMPCTHHLSACPEYALEHVQIYVLKHVEFRAQYMHAKRTTISASVSADLFVGQISCLAEAAGTDRKACFRLTEIRLCTEYQ